MPRLMERVRSFVPLIAITRDGGEGRVSLSKAGSVRIDYALDSSGVATLRHALVRMARLVRAAGRSRSWRSARPRCGTGRRPSGRAARRAPSSHFEERLGAFDFRPNRGSLFSAHQMGSVRMGSGSRVATRAIPGAASGPDVADQVVGGLYVADASLFPTAIGANPMLTVMALARRVARTVVSEA